MPIDPNASHDATPEISTSEIQAGGKTSEVEAPDAADNTETTNTQAKKREAIDALFASVAAEFAVDELTAGRRATLDDLRRVLHQTFEQLISRDYAVTLDASQRTRLCDVIDNYVARSADTFVAAGVQDTRRTGLYV